MTLGRKLSGRAWPLCSRAQRFSPKTQTAAAIGIRTLLRAQSTSSSTSSSTDTPAPEPPARPSSPPNGQPADTTTAQPPKSSLIDRLASVPVRRHGLRESVVVKPLTTYPNKVVNHESLQSHHRELYQQKRLEARRFRAVPGDWRVILQHLIDSTPTHAKPDDGIKVRIPKHSAELLKSDYANNIWNIKSRTGCAMKLCYPSDSDAADGADPYLIISGQPAAISAAVEDIKKVTRGVTVSRLHGGTETILHSDQGVHAPAKSPVASPPELVTPVHYPGPVRPFPLTMRADKVPRPNNWTVETFQQYVGTLTMGRLPGNLARRLYPGPEKHKHLVVRLLHEVFNDPEASAAISSPAFKQALVSMVRSGASLVDHAQKLFEQASKLGLPMDVDVYNLMAETSVRAKNLLSFQSTVRLMITRGIQPNIRTWVLFIRLVEAEEVRRYIIQAMDRKNFFVDPRAVIAVSNEMAPNDAYRAIKLGQDVDTFLASQRDLYGPEWRLTRYAGNKILYEFGRHGRFEESRRILEVMFESERDRPSAISLNTVITHCKHLHKIDDAIKVIHMFDQRGHYVADSVTFHLLFEMARRLKKPHLLGATWRYSHLLDLAASSMRNRGLQLFSGGKELTKFISRINSLWAGDALCKCSPQEFIEILCFYDYKKRYGPEYKTLDLGKQAEEEEALSESRESPAEGKEPSSEHPSEPPQDTPERRYIPYAKWATQTSRRREPAVPLGDFLRQALDRDLEMHDLAWKGPARPHRSLTLPPAMEPVDMPMQERTRIRAKPLILYGSSEGIEAEEMDAEEEEAGGGEGLWRGNWAEVAEKKEGSRGEKMEGVAREGGKGETKMGEEVKAKVEEAKAKFEEVVESKAEGKADGKAEEVQELLEGVADLTEPSQWRLRKYMDDLTKPPKEEEGMPEKEESVTEKGGITAKKEE